MPKHVIRHELLNKNVWTHFKNGLSLTSLPSHLKAKILNNKYLCLIFYSAILKFSTIFPAVQQNFSTFRILWLKSWATKMVPGDLLQDPVVTHGHWPVPLSKVVPGDLLWGTVVAHGRSLCIKWSLVISSKIQLSLVVEFPFCKNGPWWSPSRYNYHLWSYPPV